MAGCKLHGWSYWASGGYGRCKYSFCSLCRSQQAAERVGPSETIESNEFLKDHAEELKEEKSKFRTVQISSLYKSTDDSKLSRRDIVAGSAEDDLASRFGSMAGTYWDTDRLRDAIKGLLEGSVRAAESKYGFDKDLVFDVRLLVESEGLDAGVEKLLNYVKKRQRKDDLAAQKLAA